MVNRRSFLAASAATAAWAGKGFAAQKPADNLHIASNIYPWTTFYKRENRDWNAEVESGLAEVAQSGLDGFEPAWGSAEEAARMGQLLQKLGLQMRSYYVNSTLHDPAAIETSIKDVLAIASAVKPLGCRIIVTNPSPLQWGGPQNKTDEQLTLQGEALDRLGAALRQQGQVLAYHNHDIELRDAAREFHHMLAGTSAENVTFCLDAHWVYRGSGNSQVALFDVVKLYGKRVSEVHLRQSQDGVWTEAFGPGDIDYPRLAKALLDLGVKPHLVLEQAVEAGSPQTLNAVDAHRRGVAYAREVFAAMA